MAIKTYRKDYRTSVSKNFKSNEFACQGKGCCSSVLIDDDLVEYLQQIRDYFDSPVTITSGYRCEKHNKAVGGATGSRHTKGQAADIMVKGTKPAVVAAYAESIGVKGIGLYETTRDGYFVHIDTRSKKSFWYGQKEEYRSTFGGVNAVEEWQKAAVADGFKFPKYGIDGAWGSECEAVAKKAVCKRCFWPWKNKNLTKIVQRAVGVEDDGKFGSDTKKAVKAWQKKNGLTADGEVRLNTWKKMLKV